MNACFLCLNCWKFQRTLTETETFTYSHGGVGFKPWGANMTVTIYPRNESDLVCLVQRSSHSPHDKISTYLWKCITTSQARPFDRQCICMCKHGRSLWGCNHTGQSAQCQFPDWRKTEAAWLIASLKACDSQLVGVSVCQTEFSLQVRVHLREFLTNHSSRSLSGEHYG